MEIKIRSLSGPTPDFIRGIALWMVEETAVSFLQIAKCCGIRMEEVEFLANEEVDIEHVNPIDYGFVMQEQIDAATKHEEYDLCFLYGTERMELKIKEHLETKSKKEEEQNQKGRRRRKRTSVAKRQRKPNAIAWLLENCPGITDNKIVSLVKTTPGTVKSIRQGTYWNMNKVKSCYDSLRSICHEAELEHIVMMSNVIKEREMHETGLTKNLIGSNFISGKEDINMKS